MYLAFCRDYLYLFVTTVVGGRKRGEWKIEFSFRGTKRMDETFVGEIVVGNRILRGREMELQRG